MSASEEDIQASAAVTNLKPKSLLEDTSHCFREREIVQIDGDLSGLETFATGPAPKAGEKGRFVSLLSADGFLDADLLITPLENGVLIDVHSALADGVAGRLVQLDGVTGVDRSAARRWRVFGELPDQKSQDTGFETIRFADNRRRELGARVYRDAAEPEGFDWRHSRKWDGHAMRLGIVPDHRCLIGKEVTPAEAGFHRLLGGKDADPVPDLARRILPMRVEPSGSAIAPMTGEPILADGVEIGRVLDHEGVCAVAIITIAPWRQAIADGARIKCRDEQVSLLWPTWLSSESQGNFGPAATQI
ncbi:MAG: hypothetical protein AAFR64_03385 [Pseudomonadota bacterium]